MASKTVTYTIYNTGSIPLTLDSTEEDRVILSGSTDFEVTTQPDTDEIAPDSSTTFQITFTPTSDGDKFATVIIGNNDDDRDPFTFQIKGTGLDQNLQIRYSDGSPSLNDVDDGDDTPSAEEGTDFGNVVYGSSEARVFTVLNLDSIDTVNLTGTPKVAVSGIHAADFVVTEQPADSITAGDSTSFEITFTPGATTLRQAIVSVEHDGVDSPYTFSVQGTGIGESGGQPGAFFLTMMGA